jgi:hypothetical protein
MSSAAPSRGRTTVLKRHATLFAFLGTALIVGFVCWALPYSWWPIHIVVGLILCFPLLFVFARLFAGIPLNKLDTIDAPLPDYLSGLAPDGANIGAPANELVRSYEEFKAAASGDILADSQRFKKHAGKERADT